MRRLAAVSALILLFVLTVSCSQEHASVPEDLVEVTMEVSQARALYAASADTIARYEYRAVPDFSGSESYDTDLLSVSANGTSVSGNGIAVSVSSDGSVHVTGTASAKTTLRVASRALTSADKGTLTLGGCWSGTVSTSQPYHQIALRNSSWTLIGTARTDTGSGAQLSVSQSDIDRAYLLCYEIVIPSGYNCSANNVRFNPYVVKGTQTGIMTSEVFGACDWTAFVLDASGKASLGYFSQGRWDFYTRALNSSGAVLYSDDAQNVMLRKGNPNAVLMTMQMPSDGEKGLASISFDVFSPALESTLSSYTLRCWMTPLQFNQHAAFDNLLGPVAVATNASFTGLSGVLRMMTTGNTSAPSVKVQGYNGNAAGAVYGTGIALDGLHKTVRIEKTSGMNRLSVLFDGNVQDGEVRYDLSGLADGVYWLHFMAETPTNYNAAELSNVMLTDSQFAPTGYTAIASHVITEGSRTLQSLSWTGTPREGNTMEFTAVGTGYSQGVYLVEIELYGPSGIHIAGQSLAVRLVSGSTAQVLGHLEGGAYILAAFAVTENKKEVAGYITSDGHVRTDVTGNRGSLQIGAGTTISFRYVAAASSQEVSSITWFVDGVQRGASSSGNLTWSWTDGSVGEHEISAVLWSADGQKVGTAVALLFVGVA